MTSKSKRSALRFECGAKEIKYRTAEEDGTAELRNISTTGCALGTLSHPVEIKEKILLQIPVDSEDLPLEIQAVVVRLDENNTAVEFTLCEKETEIIIRKYFSAFHREIKNRT